MTEQELPPDPRGLDDEKLAKVPDPPAPANPSAGDPVGPFWMPTCSSSQTSACDPVRSLFTRHEPSKVLNARRGRRLLQPSANPFRPFDKLS